MSTPTNPDWLDHVREIQAAIERKGPAVVRSRMIPHIDSTVLDHHWDNREETAFERQQRQIWEQHEYAQLIESMKNQAPVPASTVKSHDYDWEKFADEERRLTELKKLEVLAEARRAIDDLNNNKTPKAVPKPVEPAAPKKRYARKFA